MGTHSVKLEFNDRQWDALSREAGSKGVSVHDLVRQKINGLLTWYIGSLESRQELQRQVCTLRSQGANK